MRTPSIMKLGTWLWPVMLTHGHSRTCVDCEFLHGRQYNKHPQLQCRPVVNTDIIKVIEPSFLSGDGKLTLAAPIAEWRCSQNSLISLSIDTARLAIAIVSSPAYVAQKLSLYATFDATELPEALPRRAAHNWRQRRSEHPYPATGEKRSAPIQHRPHKPNKTARAATGPLPDLRCCGVAGGVAEVDAVRD